MNIEGLPLLGAEDHPRTPGVFGGTKRRYGAGGEEWQLRRCIRRRALRPQAVRPKRDSEQTHRTASDRFQHGPTCGSLVLHVFSRFQVRRAKLGYLISVEIQPASLPPIRGLFGSNPAVPQPQHGWPLSAPPPRSPWLRRRSAYPPNSVRTPCLPLRAALCRTQVGTKGWSFPIEQRDAAIDLRSNYRPSSHDQFAELAAHTIRGATGQRARRAESGLHASVQRSSVDLVRAPYRRTNHAPCPRRNNRPSSSDRRGTAFAPGTRKISATRGSSTTFSRAMNGYA